MTFGVTKLVKTLSPFWDAERCKQLLHSLDYFDTDGYTEGELRELALLALQDTEDPERAARKVLALIFGNEVSPAVQRRWAADLKLPIAWHRLNPSTYRTELLAIADLLHRAFPDVYARQTTDMPIDNPITKSVPEQNPYLLN